MAISTCLGGMLDCHSSCPFDHSCESSAVMSALFLDFCEVDIWCERHLTNSNLNWFRPIGVLASRIDLIVSLYAWMHTFSEVCVI